MHSTWLTAFAAVIFFRVAAINSANILTTMPVPALSHFKSFEPLLEEIVKRGHNLTLISGFPLDHRLRENYTFVNIKPYFNRIDLEDVIRRVGGGTDLEKVTVAIHSYQNYAEEILKLPEIQEIIRSENRYDLIIAEMFFMDAFFALGTKFNAPVIALSPFKLMPFYSWIIDSPFPSSYVPILVKPFTEKMPLISRFVNIYLNIIFVLYYEFVAIPKSQTQIEKYFYFHANSTPHIRDIMKNISVTFVNAHYSVGYVKPELPNVVNVAGLHLTDRKPLPQSIQKFMDEAKNGVIYLSLGSIIQPSFAKNMGEIFIRALAHRPQRVLMKWDAKLLPAIPTNIMVQEWIPQVDVLNHLNCRLFITHGGLHSLVEGVNASIPMLGIPFFGDQSYNVKLLEYYEIGTALQIADVPQELSAKVDEILSNLKYKENIKRRSMLFQQRLVKPIDEAMFWIDHVLIHGDASHLKSAASQMAWYELYYVDILAISVGIFLLTVQIIKFVVSTIMRRVKNYVKIKTS